MHWNVSQAVKVNINTNNYLLISRDPVSSPSSLSGDNPYSLMFGPDFCSGSTNNVLLPFFFIIRSNEGSFDHQSHGCLLTRESTFCSCESNCRWHREDVLCVLLPFIMPFLSSIIADIPCGLGRTILTPFTLIINS